jgi:DeoR/GlpR family transcriptional regulator of sugar metabolism
MLALNEIHDVITVDKLAKYFDCSARTIYRNMGNELKKEKELLNQQLKEDEKV